MHSKAFPGRRALLVGLLFAAVGILGCSSQDPAPTPTPSASPTATLTPTATVPPTPRPTSTPYPRPTPPPATGRVVTRMSVGCELEAWGLVVKVRYGSAIQNTDEPAARITRVRLYMDGVLGQDSGPIADRVYAREAAFQGISSRLHTIQLRIETRAAPKPADFIQFAQCPPDPGTPLA